MQGDDVAEHGLGVVPPGTLNRSVSETPSLTSGPAKEDKEDAFDEHCQLPSMTNRRQEGSQRASSSAPPPTASFVSNLSDSAFGWRKSYRQSAEEAAAMAMTRTLSRTRSNLSAHFEGLDSHGRHAAVGLGISGLIGLGTFWGGRYMGTIGAAVGLLAILASLLDLACKSTRLTGASSCVACCCFCEECKLFSNAWHLRNLHVTIFVLALLSVMYQFPAGILLFLDGVEDCDSDFCVVPTWDVCSQCGGAAILAHRLGDTGHCCSPVASSASVAGAHVGCKLADRLTCGPQDDTDLRSFGGCAGVCSCMGGILEPGECHSTAHMGHAALLNALALCGMATSAYWVTTSLNEIIIRDGYMGAGCGDADAVGHPTRVVDASSGGAPTASPPSPSASQ